MSDLYYERLIADLKSAEAMLRFALGQQFPATEIESYQKNVDRLHKLITDYLKPTPDERPVEGDQR